MVDPRIISVMTKAAMAMVFRNTRVDPKDTIPGFHFASRILDRGGRTLQPHHAKELERDILAALQKAGGKNLSLGSENIEIPMFGGKALLTKSTGAPSHQLTTLLESGMPSSPPPGTIEGALKRQMGEKASEQHIRGLKDDLKAIKAKYRALAHG